MFKIITRIIFIGLLFTNSYAQTSLNDLHECKWQNIIKEKGKIEFKFENLINNPKAIINYFNERPLFVKTSAEKYVEDRIVDNNFERNKLFLKAIFSLVDIIEARNSTLNERHIGQYNLARLYTFYGNYINTFYPGSEIVHSYYDNAVKEFEKLENLKDENILNLIFSFKIEYLGQLKSSQEITSSIPNKSSISQSSENVNNSSPKGIRKLQSWFKNIKV